MEDAMFYVTPVEESPVESPNAWGEIVLATS
jgi:hypothetical protein